MLNKTHKGVEKELCIKCAIEEGEEEDKERKRKEEEKKEEEKRRIVAVYREGGHAGAIMPAIRMIYLVRKYHITSLAAD
ncbi:hypothetical protein E2C01_059841 [Portunus trituberculatus]|uniref:Uncharacterized protein n=1 Tax=Portunus trituberculatus TaxID=210409 RepID=A0A5B7H7Q8_PORTR|nr:hypothetical protein [Portunus trituberculatus]